MRTVLDIVRADFIARRRTGLGGSDIAAVLGIPGAYRGAYAVWLEKRGEAPPEIDEETSDLLDLGNLLEPAVLAWAARDAGADLVPAMFVRRDRPHDFMQG